MRAICHVLRLYTGKSIKFFIPQWALDGASTKGTAALMQLKVSLFLPLIRAVTPLTYRCFEIVVGAKISELRV